MYYGEGGEEEKPPEQKYKYLYILSVLDIYLTPDIFLQKYIYIFFYLFRGSLDFTIYTLRFKINLETCHHI